MAMTPPADFAAALEELPEEVAPDTVPSGDTVDAELQGYAKTLGFSDEQATALKAFVAACMDQGSYAEDMPESEE
jgi:hypothetical protein